jgi:hypothetical protein
MATVPISPIPNALPEEMIAQRFQELAEAWHRETDYLSSMSEADSHQAYQDIIRLGQDVIPLLLRDLEENHTHWFTALRILTGANPVPASMGGNIPKMVEAWLTWVKEHGYRW